MIFPRSAWKWPTFAIACGAALQLASGTTPEYFIQDAGAGGATCAINGGSAVQDELECRKAAIALYDSEPLEMALNAIPPVCEIPSGCLAFWVIGGRVWTYTTAYPQNNGPSGCVTSAEPAEPNDSPYVGWVAGDNDETCGTGGAESMFCICKTDPTGSPTTAGPTGSPTTGPTGSPTTAGPTGSPTTTGPTGQSTTPAITSAPWTIDFVGMDSDFSSSSGDEVVMKYEIGKGRAYEASLHEEDCAAGIADVTVNTTKARANINETHDLLTLSHSFDKSAIGNSTIWDNEAGKIEICQIVRLILPEADGQVKMDIVEDTREVDIDFTLSADFAIENELGAGTVESAAGETNVSSYVSACKCNGPGNFSCDPEPLVPNTQLHVCITSVSADVQVKELKSMVVKQGAALMNVVLGGLVQISSIADRTYVEAENGVVVSTFVPTNVFDYAAGASINITGGVDMELASSTRRLLAEAVDGDAVDADGNGQEFDLRVDLQDEAIVLEGEGGWADSSGALLGGASALLGAALLLAHGMW